MNANEIDEVLKASKDAKISKMLELIKIGKIYGNITRFCEKNADELTRKVMKMIEEGDFEYFLSKIDDESYKYECLNMLQYSTKTEVIKQVIEEQRTKIDRRDSFALMGLIESTKDPKYIESIIERIVYKKEDWNFSQLGLLQIIESTKDAGYIKGILENKEKLFNDFKIIDKNYIERLVIATGDSDYIKSIIENKSKQEEFYFDIKNLHGLLKATKDAKYIESKIEEKSKREEKGLYDSHLVEMVLATKDVEYITQIIEDKEKREEYGFKNYHNLKNIIINLGDIEYIKSIIENREKQKKLSLDKLEILDLIIATEDFDYIKQIVNDEKKIDEIGLDEFDKTLLITETEDLKYINEFLEQKESELKQKEVSSKIEIPNSMTIGIEIECEGKNSKAIKNLSNIISDGWVCKEEGSLESGIEIVSPILTGDNEKTSEQINKVCMRLQALRTNSIRKMWWPYTYWFRISNYGRKLE